MDIIELLGSVRKSKSELHIFKIYCNQATGPCNFYEIHFVWSLSKDENLLRQCTYALADAKTVLHWKWRACENPYKCMVPIYVFPEMTVLLES